MKLIDLIKNEVNFLSAAHILTRNQCQLGLREIVKQEEIKWMKRATDIDLKHGDSNPRYYH
jgi:uncharacterized protein (DUF2225 family)